MQYLTLKIFLSEWMKALISVTIDNLKNQAFDEQMLKIDYEP